MKELGINNNTSFGKDEILANHKSFMTSLNIPSGKESEDLLYLYWIPKIHKTPCKERYIAVLSTCSRKELSIHLTKIMSAVTEGQHTYCEAVYTRSGIHHMWILKNTIEVSLHVSVIHRHAMLEYDGIDSNEENPNVIAKHFYVISPDQQHDHFFFHEVRKQISEYMKSISCDITSMHEFTDECPSQCCSTRPM
jgi:hypothetical protein